MAVAGRLPALLLVLAAAGCGTPPPVAVPERPAAAAAAAFDLRLPRGFPPPRVPPDNPMTAAKVELGRHLFYDRRLSVDGAYACADCHLQELAFTDGRGRAVGATGELHPRSAMSLANVAYNASLGWDDPDLLRLEDQAKVPMFNRRPVELGLAGRRRRTMARLLEDPLYRRMFAAAFPEVRGRFTLRHVRRALASFERTLISGDAPFDRWLAGDNDALAPAARRGMKLFFSARLGCFGCHRGFNFSGPVTYEGSGDAERVFLNTGLYDLDGRGAYPPPNTGVHRVTGRRKDMGRFRVPTLRNVALTAPYMHDGSVATLGGAIDLYAAGGRTASPLKSRLLGGFELSAEEKSDLVRFLESLSDEAFVTDPRFSDPFTDPRHPVEAVQGGGGGAPLSVRSISRWSQARATRVSRFTVAVESSRHSATSSTVRPPK